MNAAKCSACGAICGRSEPGRACCVKARAACTKGRRDRGRRELSRSAAGGCFLRTPSRCGRLRRAEAIAFAHRPGRRRQAGQGASPGKRLAAHKGLPCLCALARRTMVCRLALAGGTGAFRENAPQKKLFWLFLRGCFCTLRCGRRFRQGLFRVGKPGRLCIQAVLCGRRQGLFVQYSRVDFWARRVIMGHIRTNPPCKLVLEEGGNMA